MKFVVLTDKEFKDFAYKHEQASFYQTLNWAKLKEDTGWTSHLVGVKDKDKVIAASLILSKSTPIKKNMFYAPRGFLIDYNDMKLLEFFTKELKDYAKKNNAIFVKIDPYISYQERDINGDIVENGKNNFKAFDNLVKLKYKHKGFNLMQEELQPRWIFITPTKGKSIESIFEGMDAKTRQILRKNERNKIRVREIGLDEIDKFKAIMEHTGERRGFIDRPLSYYESMYNALIKDKMIKICLAELNTDELILEYADEISVIEEEIKLRDAQYKKDPSKMNPKKIEQKRVQALKDIERIEKNITHIRKLKKENGKILTLGGIMFLISNNEVLSSVGGSFDKFMEFQSAYTLHFWGLKYALDNNYERYNFYGITGNFDESNPLFGLYSFKRDFGGQVVELIGEFDLIINKPLYILYKLAFKAYQSAKHIKNKIHSK